MAYAPIVFAYSLIALFEEKVGVQKQIYLYIEPPEIHPKGRMDN